jgi:ectoine hydroxylase-related dioxygenase (phytanoyl-CoA dioxygenase family)
MATSLLTSDQLSDLDRDGFVSLGQLLSTNQLEEIRNRVDELVLEEGEMGGHELFDSKHIQHPKEEGADRIANLVNKGAVFDIFYTHPMVLAAVQHVIGPDLHLSSLNFRSAKPGKGQQKLHADWKEGVKPMDFKVCNSIWLLDEFTNQNGATRVIPGSHLLQKVPAEVLEYPEAPHPEEVLILAPAGTVIIFNAHIWHGGTTNCTKLPRRAIHSYFCRADQPQQTDQIRWITKETLDRVSDQSRKILNV